MHSNAVCNQFFIRRLLGVLLETYQSEGGGMAAKEALLVCVSLILRSYILEPCLCTVGHFLQFSNIILHLNST